MDTYTRNIAVASGKLDSEKRYWQSILDKDTTFTALPYCRIAQINGKPRIEKFAPQDIFHSREKRRFELTIPPEIAADILKMSNSSPVALSILLSFGVIYLLQRYANTNTAVVAMPVFKNNPTAGQTNSVIALKQTLAHDESFRVNLIRWKETVQLGLKNQNFPLENLAELLGWPLVDGRLHLKTAISFVGLHDPAAFDDYYHDILFLFAHNQGTLTATLAYNPDLFSSDYIENIGQHLNRIYAMLLHEPDKALSTVEILSEKEKATLLSGFNPSGESFPVDTNLGRIFEEQAALWPENVAVVFDGEQLTYRELNARANQLARFLRSKGVVAGTLVGILVERSLEMLVGLLGILKAGGAYVPLDPAYPRDRLAYMLRDSQTPLLVTQSQLQAALPEHQADVIYLDTDWKTIARESRANPDYDISPANLAYVIYTSGSTGKPKGVMVNHANVIRLFAATQAWFHFNSQDVWSLFHSYAFDFSVWEIWGALFYGGRLVIVPYQVSRSPWDFYQLMLKEQITVLNQTPSAFRQLLLAEETAPADDVALRLVIFGGEALNLENLKPWFSRHGDTTPRLVNMYGITETTVHVTYRPLNWEDVQGKFGSVIGCPIPDLQVYILDQYLQPSPLGVPGEMYVGGAGVSHGYLNKNELTAQRFIADPFRKNPGARLYRTGDLARRLPDGDIEYLGRIDFQLQIRGFRVELGEIEATISTHPAVKENVVVARTPSPEDVELVAYIVSTDKSADFCHDLRAHLKKTLPDHMIPAICMFLEALPLTQNGKVDRRALPEPKKNIPEAGRVAPRNEIEIRLATIWGKILDIPEPGITDNFFDFGGHSLLAVRLMNKIQQEFHKNIPLASLLRNPTIEHLSVLLQQHREPEPWSPLVPIRASGTALPLFCIHPADGSVFGYSRFVQLLDPKYPVYGLQAFGREAPSIPLTRIEDMAQKYIEAMRSVHAGPYVLAGFSAGGVIAYEMTRQLRAMGEAVPLTILMDTSAPHLMVANRNEVDNFLAFATAFGGFIHRDLMPFYCEVRNIPPNTGIQMIREDISRSSEKERLEFLWQSAVNAGSFDADIGVDYLRRIFHVYNTIISAITEYQPEPADGSMVLFRAKEEWEIARKMGPNGASDRDMTWSEKNTAFGLGWSRYQGAMEVEEVPGYHFTMLTEPHVQTLVQRVTAHLEKIERQEAMA